MFDPFTLVLVFAVVEPSSTRRAGMRARLDVVDLSSGRVRRDVDVSATVIDWLLGDALTWCTCTMQYEAERQ